MTFEGTATAPSGIEPESLTAWLRQHVAWVREPLRFIPIPGGRSNLTFRGEGPDGRALIVRRPPLGQRLATAHDMVREYRVLTALRDTAIPTPRVLGLCEDETVIGAPFYAMEFVDGLVLRTEDDALAAFDESGRRRAGEHVVDALAALHAVDPDAVGLGTFGRPNGYVERQLARWTRQWEKSRRIRIDAIETVGRRLARHIPAQSRARLVHGDYRVDNVILDPESAAVRAVLDWELCTLGDPLADLGLLLVYSPEPGTPDAAAGLQPATLAPGFPSRAELIERYARRSGADVSDIGYFVALGYWKLAIILQGVNSRELETGGARPDPSHPMQALVESLARSAEAASNEMF